MLKISIRTCVVCRDKVAQNLLNRLQCKDNQLTLFTGVGRSFYICNSCLNDEKRLKKSLFRQCKNKDDKYITQLRELLADGRQS